MRSKVPARWRLSSAVFPRTLALPACAAGTSWCPRSSRAAPLRARKWTCIGCGRGDTRPSSTAWHIRCSALRKPRIRLLASRALPSALRSTWKMPRSCASSWGRLGLRCMGANTRPICGWPRPTGRIVGLTSITCSTKAHIVGTPGAGFGAAGEGYLRLSAFNHRDRIEEAMERISQL